MNFDAPIDHKKDPWEQKTGESSFWYARFHRFLMAGASRSINATYRAVINEKRVAESREKLQKSARAGSSWLKIAKKWDWVGRAEAWDDHQRRQAMKSVSESLNLVRFAAQEAVQFQINLMRGRVKLVGDDGGELEILLSLDEIQQMRLASNSILNRAGVVYDGSLASEEDGETPILAFQILHKGSDGD